MHGLQLSVAHPCKISVCCVRQELLIKLVEDHYPMPPDPNADPEAAAEKAGKGRGRRGTSRRRSKVWCSGLPAESEDNVH